MREYIALVRRVVYTNLGTESDYIEIRGSCAERAKLNAATFIMNDTSGALMSIVAVFPALDE